MRIKHAIRRIKKHNINGQPLYFYNVDKKSDFYKRVLNYVSKHKINFDFQLYTKEYNGVTFPMNWNEDF